MPAAVASEGFESEERFVAGATPELAWAFEAALVLAAGRFDRAAAERFAAAARTSVVEAVLVFAEVVDLALHRRRPEPSRRGQ